MYRSLVIITALLTAWMMALPAAAHARTHESHSVVIKVGHHPTLVPLSGAPRPRPVLQGHALPAGFINFSCGGTGGNGYDATKATNKSGWGTVYLDGSTSGAYTWLGLGDISGVGPVGWGVISQAEPRSDAELLWSDDGGKDFHVCGPVYVPSGGTYAFTRANNFVAGRAMASCGFSSKTGNFDCTGWLIFT